MCVCVCVPVLDEFLLCVWWYSSNVYIELLDGVDSHTFFSSEIQVDFCCCCTSNLVYEPHHLWNVWWNKLERERERGKETIKYLKDNTMMMMTMMMDSEVKVYIYLLYKSITKVKLHLTCVHCGSWKFDFWYFSLTLSTLAHLIIIIIMMMMIIMIMVMVDGWLVNFLIRLLDV